MRVTIECDQPVTVAPATPSGEWTIFGVWDAGDPCPLAALPGGEVIAHRNPNFPGGVWSESVSADTPVQAAKRGAQQARERQAPLRVAGEWPASA